MKSSFTIRKTDPDEYAKIEKIFEAQGLENNKDGVTILKGYAVEVFDRLIGGAEVMLQEGEYTFSIAVDTPYKRRGIGKSLFNIVKNDIRTFGAKRIMIQAKTPEYWKKYGFVDVDLSDVPKTFRCDDCSKYGVDCFPKILILYL